VNPPTVGSGQWVWFACPGCGGPANRVLYGQAPALCDKCEEGMGDLDLLFDTEPIIGWRVWSVLPYERRGGITEHHLHALNSGGGHWRPGQRMEAHCRLGVHDAPWPSCQCGLWALCDRMAAEEQSGIKRGALWNFTVCVGKVALWGRVLEYERGYRAQYAYPQELIFYGGDGLVANEVGQLYGVPVKTVAATNLEVEEKDLQALLPGGWITVPLNQPLSSGGALFTSISIYGSQQLGPPPPQYPQPPRPMPTFKDAIRSSRQFPK
jgi:hypothetical protein